MKTLIALLLAATVFAADFAFDSDDTTLRAGTGTHTITNQTSPVLITNGPLILTYGSHWANPDFVYPLRGTSFNLELNDVRISLTLSTNVTTNWVTVSRTVPEPCGMIGCTVYHATMANQVGTVTTNRIVTMAHEGVTNETRIAILGRAPDLSRSIDENQVQNRYHPYLFP